MMTWAAVTAVFFAVWMLGFHLMDRLHDWRHMRRYHRRRKREQRALKIINHNRIGKQNRRIR